jgi:hypothetical protein
VPAPRGSALVFTFRAVVITFWSLTIGFVALAANRHRRNALRIAPDILFMLIAVHAVYLGTGDYGRRARPLHHSDMAAVGIGPDTGHWADAPIPFARTSDSVYTEGRGMRVPAAMTCLAENLRTRRLVCAVSHECKKLGSPLLLTFPV